MSNKTMDHQTEEKTGSQQRTVLKQALAAALAAGIVPVTAQKAAAAQGTSGLGVSGPVKSKRILKSSHTTTSTGEEVTMVVELVGADDVKTLASVYLKRLDTGGEYDVFTVTHAQYFQSPNDTTAARTLSRSTSVHGKKGEVRSDYRIDEHKITIMTDGNISTMDHIQTKILLNNPYEALSDQNLIDAVICFLFSDNLFCDAVKCFIRQSFGV
jgi:hypothetical protein